MATQIVHGNQIGNLKQVIERMDCASQGAFNDIAAIARLALLALESPHGCRDTRSLAAALVAIEDRANTGWHLVNNEAVDAECGYTDLEALRRAIAQTDARTKAEQSGVAHG